jgi:hypothetical protein
LLSSPSDDSASLLRREADRRYLAEYEAFVREVEQSPIAQRSQRLALSDDLVVALLARLLGAVSSRVTVAPEYPIDPGIPAEGLDLPRARARALFSEGSREFERQTLERIAGGRALLSTLLDAIDESTLALFHQLGGDTARGGLVQVDLLTALESPDASDVARFALEILQTVQEAKGEPSGSTLAAHGTVGLARRGSLDNLVLTELAWDEEELMRRIADEEVLYYAREESPEIRERHHHLLIDASASMRGQRATFARARRCRWGGRPHAR